jgi:very-short-patch-repair endonuclease
MRDFTNFRSALEPERSSDEEYPDQMPPIRRLGDAIAVALPHIEAAARMAKVTESPIEVMLGVALVDIMPEGWQLIPQLKWRVYRIDWCLRRPGKPDIFIECDGKEFHTKPEHVARDQRRDAEMARAGIKIMRFTGAQIFNSANWCALQVYREAME